ncbi:hypothetical protein [Achromobacter xylosoxidans]|uniref:hypothetical protein n=1 Tax=Alcaligenes xylosoxydans xylosoxydans TaxID=85698 RepID=UPI0022B9361F|nr:hypothetical protein [Achromobacter xylosoxidans]MCZ8390521.1 hypothetical protein [Achromobacter xylosoxidans]
MLSLLALPLLVLFLSALSLSGAIGIMRRPRWFWPKARLLKAFSPELFLPTAPSLKNAFSLTRLPGISLTILRSQFSSAANSSAAIRRPQFFGRK